jgi:predicted acetyltransferase
VSKIKPLPQADLNDFVKIVANAYPGLQLKTESDYQNQVEKYLKFYKQPSRCLYGLYRDGHLLGGMLVYDFTVNVHSFMIPAGGVGLVAVDLLHKKERVAKELLTFLLEHFRYKGVSLLMLYSFRPDFYRRMGFGYGTKISQYRVLPTALPRSGKKEEVRYLYQEDKEAILRCYKRNMLRRHGMIKRMPWELNILFEDNNLRIIGHERDGELTGYLSFMFELGQTFLENDIYVREMVFNDRNSRQAMLTFLHTQLDQVRRIIINTFDDTFHFLLSDPRTDTGHVISPAHHESNIQGVGLMYRVIDVPGFLRSLNQHNFGGGTLDLKIIIDDSFFPKNSGSYYLRVVEGDLKIDKDYPSDVTIRLDIAEFSSLVMGSVGFRSIYEYALVKISDPSYVDNVDRIFSSPQKPVCLTRF